MHKIFDCNKESGEFYVPTEFLARKLCQLINSQRPDVFFDWDKCYPLVEKIRLIKTYDEIWTNDFSYSYVYTRKMIGRWLAIYR